MEDDGMTRLRYIQWDRTGDAQIIKVFATQFASTYLGSVAGAVTSKTGGDRAHYGRASFNAVTNAVSGQSIEIRGKDANSTSLSCIKTMFAGTLGGSIDGYRPALGTPDVVTDPHTDGTNLDGIKGVVDNVNTTSGGTLVNAPATLPAAFDYSCNDINSAAGTGKAFANGGINFTADPSTIFPH